ncbi:uncharacterized protein PRCAT00004658001 [Priceomyces carsonii]|uniref:uncharacterized protein n=1 Tax=Priceomyces carsonii TaxID=28549 RepID=UPI002ED7A031|nr:unnamed protein product [Priceomyces carsonii]
MGYLTKGSPYDAKVVSIEHLPQGKWIQTRKINYQDPTGKNREWEMAVRTTRTDTTNVDAVAIFSVLCHPDKPKEVVLEKQFRPPTEKVIVELPAGLVDPNESIATTAIRELREETGYHGVFKRQSTLMFNDPGLSNANMVVAFVDVDLKDHANIDPKPELEEGEFIETFSLPLDNLLEELEDLLKKEGCVVDARLYHLAIGLDVAKRL